MKRRLRIAVSVFFALVAVAFAALWVRSYWRTDSLYVPLADSKCVLLQPIWGVASIRVADIACDWRFRSDPYPANFSDRLIRWRWYWSSDARGIYVGIPFWYPVLLSAALAIVPWTRWLTRFSLRTLLIATTFVAVALGLVVWAGR